MSINFSSSRIAHLCRVTVGVFFFFMMQPLLHAQKLPLGYISYYSQKGNTPDFLSTLVINPLDGFEISNGRNYVTLNPTPYDSSHIVISPSCKGIISDKIFGEYIIEFEYKIQIGALNYSSGFYFLSPIKSDDTYYATIFSNDTIAFIYVDDGYVKKNESIFISGINVGWNKVRIQRDMLNRSLNITLNDNTNETVSFSDRDLVMGFVGFGTQNISSYLRNVNIWAPTAFSDTLYIGQ